MAVCFDQFLRLTISRLLHVKAVSKQKKITDISFICLPTTCSATAAEDMPKLGVWSRAWSAASPGALAGDCS